MMENRPLFTWDWKLIFNNQSMKDIYSNEATFLPVINPVHPFAQLDFEIDHKVKETRLGILKIPC